MDIQKVSFPGSNQIIQYDLTNKQEDLLRNLRSTFGAWLQRSPGDTLQIESKQRFDAKGANQQVVDMVYLKGGKKMESRVIQVGNSQREWLRSFRKLLNIDPLNYRWVKLITKHMLGRI